jgi:hypothetical protein
LATLPNSVAYNTVIYGENERNVWGKDCLRIIPPTHLPEYPEGAQEWEKEVEMEPRGGREWEGSRGEGE